MTEKGKKYLSDILNAIELIEQFTIQIKRFDQYQSDFKTNLMRRRWDEPAQ